jgi:hypothetical protein
MDRMNKKISTINVLVFCVGVMIATIPSYAALPVRGILKDQVREVKREVVQEEKKNILEEVKKVIREKIKKQIKGKLITIAGSTLTVQNDKTIYTVTTTSATQLKRRFGADSTLGEFSPNDELLVIGNRKKNTDGTLSSTDIEASYIRNMSIQRRFAVFNGEVLTVSSNMLTLKTKSRGTQTVYISSKTQFKEKNTSLLFTDIQVGDNLIVKGELWDRATDKIDAKSILKLANKKSITPLPTQGTN